MTDTFRRKYKQLSDNQVVDVELIKIMAEALESSIDASIKPSNARLMAMAKSHLEISIVCAVKGITT